MANPFNKTKRMVLIERGSSNHWNIIFKSLKSEEDNRISPDGRKGSFCGLIANVKLTHPST